MNAIEFVKQNGIEKAKQIIDLCPLSTLINIDGIGVSISDLKQIVMAFDLIEKDFESVQIADYEYIVSDCYSDQYWIEVRKAINLLEQCQK